MRYHLNKITRILQVFLIADILFFLALAWINAAEIYSLLSVDSYTVESSIRPVWRDDFYEKIQIAESAFHLLFLFLFFVIWIYRATFNLQLVFGRQSISPGWAAGWNFIPFANFIMVYRAMANLWFHFSAKPVRYGFLLLWWLLAIVVPLCDIVWNIIADGMDPSEANFLLAAVIQFFILVGCCLVNIMEIRVVNVIARGEAQAGNAVAGVFS